MFRKSLFIFGAILFFIGVLMSILSNIYIVINYGYKITWWESICNHSEYYLIPLTTIIVGMVITYIGIKDKDE